MVINYKILFAISATIFFFSFITLVFLSPELTVNLTKLSWIPDELDPVQLEKGKEILKRCDVSEEEFNRINQVLFDAEKEFYLNNNTVKAEKIFKTVLGDIISCNLRSEGGTIFLDTILGKIVQLVTIVSGITSTIVVFLGYRKHGKDFL